MDRRAFFRRAAGKTTELAVKELDKKVEARAAHWIRPPFALDELDFLLACTRCKACIEACPDQVIFPLSARLGADVVSTPALDLSNKGCRLCEDWPCVQACEPRALKIPDTDEKQEEVWPRLAYVVINTETCLPYSGPECGACAPVCKVQGALVWNRERPEIDYSLCTGCAMCREVCVVTPSAIKVKSLNSVNTAGAD